MYFDLSRVPMRTRLEVLDNHQRNLERYGRSYWDQSPWERKLDLAGIDTNAKLTKGDDAVNAVQHFAPATRATDKGTTVCANAIRAGCQKPCLDDTGRGAFATVQASRLYKTMLWTQKRDEYLDYFHKREMPRLKRTAKRKGKPLALRLNGTSDVDWSFLAEQYPDVIWYDYTKHPERLGNTPDNYHLTLSYSEKEPEYAAECIEALNSGHNLAIVCKSAAIHADLVERGSWRGYPTVNGELSDQRFLDPRGGYVVLLTPKGKAKRDTSGFTVGY